MLLQLFYFIKRGGAVWLFSLLCCCSLAANAQFFEPLEKRVNIDIPFRFIRNLIVIQLKINNKGPFNFILDTGVGTMLITEPSLIDSIKIPNKRIIKIAGFGEGDNYEAYITAPLDIEIPGLVSYGVSTAILKRDPFGLSAYAGIPIHGLLGYEFFNHLAVKINFADTTLTVAQPRNMRIYRKANKIPITIEEHKPYMQAKVIFADGTEKESKLIIDLGAGHPISLENVKNKNTLQKVFVPANLGMGLQGLISGSISRIKEVQIGKYKIKNVIASFPNDDTRSLAVPRDGNLGMAMLKRFNVIFDYTNSVLYLKPNYAFNEHFEHDMSGLGYSAAGNDYSHVVIDKVEPGSPADEIGLKKDDEITMINFKAVDKMGLQQIDDLFRSGNGRTLLLEIYRDKRYFKVLLTLKRRI